MSPFRRDDWQPSLSNRGQAALIGFVLLLGMVATVSIGIFLVAGETITDAEQQTEKERVEQAFVELGKTMSTAAADTDGKRSVDFDAGDSGAITKSDAGRIWIYGGDEELVNESIGAIEYEGDDGSIVAYQSGGVWSERGNQTRMLSEPNIEYDSDADTLWFPMSTLPGDQTLSSGEISVEHNSTDPIKDANYVQDNTTTVQIQSDYYRGWEQFFRDEAGDASIQEVHHNNRTIEVLLGYDELDNAFDEGATIGGGEDAIDDHHDIVGDEHETGVPMPPMNDVIDELIEDADGGDGDDIDRDLTGVDDTEEGAGTYYVDEIDGDITYDFNLTDGDVTLIVEENIDLDGDGHVNVTDRDESDENVLRIYSGGDRLTMDGNICYTTDCESDASVIQYYGPSDQGVDFGPGSKGDFEGLLYVASEEEEDWWDDNPPSNSCSSGSDGNDYQVHLQANGEFFGSIVAYSVCGKSDSVEFSHDTDVDSDEIEMYPDEYRLPPQITYLNVALHELDVKND